jgi:CheY-like chemotaxis protein
VILVIEDNPAAQLAVVALLNRSGFRAIGADTDIEAMAALDRQAFDLVILDLHLGETCGVDLAKRIRQLPQPAGSMPIIGLSASSSDALTQAAIEAGMALVLAKPIRRAELAGAVTACLASSSQRRAETVADGPDAMLDGQALPLIDMDSLAQLREEIGEDSAGAVIAIFLQDAERRLLRMRAAADNGAFGEVRQDAHSLKGTAQSIGFPRIAEASNRLEELNRRERVNHQSPAAYLDLIAADIFAIGALGLAAPCR